MTTTPKQAINTASEDIDNKCPYCDRVFIRKNTLDRHVCEQKRRFMDKDKPANRIAYGAWKQFYTRHHPTKRKLEYENFIDNLYYTAFVKFGIYCVAVKVINPASYAVYLSTQRIPIDNWNSDATYTKYLMDYLKVENCLDAVRRSVETMLDLSHEGNIQLCDVFRFTNSNKICQMIATGKISPWILYHTKTGIEFLSKLNADQTSLVFDYIDPEKWNIKFKRSAEEVAEVCQVINSIAGI